MLTYRSFRPVSGSIFGFCMFDLNYIGWQIAGAEIGDRVSGGRTRAGQ